MTPNKQNTILITGASGFIGSALCRSLLGYHNRKRVLVRNSDQAENYANISGFESVLGDLNDAGSLLDACADVDVVLHLAGVAHVNPENDDSSHQVIVEGTRNLLKAAVACKVKRIVYLSSTLAQAAENGSGDVTAYGKYKSKAEKLLLESAARSGIQVVILRPVNVYGVGMKGNIASMISLIQRRRLPPLPALSTRLSLVSVEDVVQALRLAMAAPQAAGKTYTVTDGEIYAILDIEQSIYAALGRRFPRWRCPRVVLFTAAAGAGLVSSLFRTGSAIGIRTYRNITSDNLFDNQAICRDLGFEPSTSLYQVLPSIAAKISQKPGR